MNRLPEFRLETYFSRWEFAAQHHLTASDAQTLTLSELLALADADDLAAWETMSFGYTETFGDPGLRQAISETYEAVTADDVICFAGAEEALFLAMQVLLTATITPSSSRRTTRLRKPCRCLSAGSPEWRSTRSTTGASTLTG